MTRYPREVRTSSLARYYALWAAVTRQPSLLSSLLLERDTLHDLVNKVPQATSRSLGLLKDLVYGWRIVVFDSTAHRIGQQLFGKASVKILHPGTRNYFAETFNALERLPRHKRTRDLIPISLTPLPERIIALQGEADWIQPCVTGMTEWLRTMMLHQLLHGRVLTQFLPGVFKSRNIGRGWWRGNAKEIIKDV